MVSITIQHLAAPPDLTREMRSLQSAVPGSTISEASVVGAEAFFLNVGTDGTQLHVVREGRLYVLVSVLGLGAPAHVSATALNLARTVLGRLPAI